MANVLYRLGRFAYRRWKLVIVAWLLAVIGLGALATSIKQPMKDEFTIPGIPSEQAQDIQQELFPGTKSAFDDATGTLVVAAPKGHTLKEPAYSQAVDALMEADAASVVIAATHPIFSGPATERLRDSSAREVIVTNTLPIPEEKQFDKLTCLSIAPLISQAIHEVFEDGSVTSLFDPAT